ncbi:tRNA 2-thiouridine(34) synthase MnmA [Algihabitans albus]|uniref:tRNA 2-thiouridine(34) synthase MnmA n=1 Tax=Algihabitans albus TaxID=2164067 RepID=UPI000E5C5842|nr:tRNA 2-thiouridine(34) synthase MnmA [Algihabitans albus]
MQSAASLPGLAKPPQDTRVVVAMSGGVDSSVTAALMAERGYEVIGITLQLYDHGQAVGKKGACCAGQDIYDARRVADRLGIAHYVLDYESRFRDAVIDDFADSYLRGETPIPCVRCNQRVKFRDLLETARDLGADALATGHYVQRLQGREGPELHRAVDAARDQSYFLFATTAEQLAFLQFPLGGLPKAETRAEAERLDLAVADKPDSQDICFVPTGGYASVVEKLRPGAADPGEIVDLTGRVVGRHEGVIRYTIGQRRGLGVGGTAEPLYVVRLEPEARRVVVGPKAALAKDRVTLRQLNWLAASLDAAGTTAVEVKLRSAQAPVAGRIVQAGEGGATVLLDAPQYGIAPGQAAVCYAGSRVLGGGWIAAADSRAAVSIPAAAEASRIPASAASAEA